MLLERPGGLVKREELRRALWPSDTYVDFDRGLNAAINRLRHALRRKGWSEREQSGSRRSSGGGGECSRPIQLSPVACDLRSGDPGPWCGRRLLVLS
jgi:Transcriptional regulatory protein, C terminal